MRLFQASKRTFFKNLLLLLSAALEEVIYEVTFLRQHDSMHNNLILGQNRIFSVNEAETQPRLNTDSRLMNECVVNEGISSLMLSVTRNVTH